jgi:transposase-like protein
MARRIAMPTKQTATDGHNELPLSYFACPNSDCANFNRFGADNLSVCEQMGKGKAIRRLYCHTCGHRFSERKGSLMEDTKLPEQTVVRVVKCLAHGNGVEATADICEVDQRSVQRILEKAGPRAEAFHRLQLEQLEQTIEAVQLDELHGRGVGQVPSESTTPRKKVRRRRIKKKAKRGFT